MRKECSQYRRGFPEVKQKNYKTHHPVAIGTAQFGAEDSGGFWPSALGRLEEAGAGSASRMERASRGYPRGTTSARLILQVFLPKEQIPRLS